MDEKQNQLKMLPSLDLILSQPQAVELAQRFSREWVKEAAGSSLQEIRKLVVQHPNLFASREQILARALELTADTLKKTVTPSLKTVINATGIILHTGLGRAPYSPAAQERVQALMSGYCNLELDMTSGERGERNDHISGLLCELTGAEAAVMVNNNAAAVFLSLNALCFDQEVIVSRGQLIEIGGSFRLPDVMQHSGVKLKEIGSTNKTRFEDYERAITANTGAIFVAHTSNYRVLGFTEEVALSPLADLAHKNGIPLLHDLGGGVLVDLRRFDLPYEPLVQDSLAAGCDVITFSGDKILGGPQAGVIVGKKKYIDRIHKNPIMRAVRCDKLTIAAMEATLQIYFSENRLLADNRTLAMLTEKEENIKARAERLVAQLHPSVRSRYQIRIEQSTGQVGSGALPLEKLASWSLVLTPLQNKASLLAHQLRSADPPVVGYIQDDKVYLDLRTVGEQEVNNLVMVINKLTNGDGGRSS